MLVTCPHCNKKIGEGQFKCPQCKEVFSDRDFEKMTLEKSTAERVLQKEKFLMLEAFRKKRRLFLNLLIGSMVFMVISLPLIFRFALSAYPYLAAVPFVIVIGVIILGVVSGAAVCPFCGSMLVKNQGDYCSKCGERIS